MFLRMMIRKDSNKKCYKNNYKSETRKAKYIKYLIISSIKCMINPPKSSCIKDCFKCECNPKNTLMYLIKYYQKCEVDEWKEEHTMSIWT